MIWEKIKESVRNVVIRITCKYYWPAGSPTAKPTLFECWYIWHESTNWGHYIFTTPSGDGIAILRGHLSHTKV